MFSISETYPGLWPAIFEEYTIRREINGREWCFAPYESVTYPVRVFCIRLGIQTIGM